MTVDYQANDPATGRTVVLTVPSPDTVDSPELLARFYREARAAGALQHPNIVAIYDLGVDRGSPYIARELLEGQELGQITEREREKGVRSPRAAARLLDYIVQVCGGLAYAHQRGIIHRNVNPRSIFVTKDGTAKLTQFVYARLPNALSPITDGRVVGTMEYMSPEQIRGDRVDSGVDIWGVGCTIYEVLTGRKPFHGESMTAWMLAIVSQEPTPVSELRRDLSAEVDEVVRRALKKVRKERYKNVEKLIADLEPLVLRMQGFQQEP